MGTTTDIFTADCGHQTTGDDTIHIACGMDTLIVCSDACVDEHANTCGSTTCATRAA